MNPARPIPARATPTANGQTPRPRRAVTLIEMVITIVVITLVIGLTASAVGLMTTGGASVAAGAENRRAAALALHRLSSEMGLATTVSELTSHAMTFQVPDITGDSTADSIRYSWSGAAGDPLLRRVNAEAAQPLVANCTAFTLQVDADMTVQYNNTSSTTGEVLIASHDTCPSGYANTSSNTSASSNNRTAAYFVPQYPNAVSCNVTHMRLAARRFSSTNLPILVGVWNATSSTHTPTGNAINEQSLALNSASSSFNWYDLYYGGAIGGLIPGAGYVVQVYSGYSTPVIYLETHTLTSTTCDDGLEARFSTDAGATWTPTSPNLRSDICLEVYGTYNVVTPDPNPLVTAGVLKAVYLELGATNGGRKCLLRSAARCLNAPALTGFAYNGLPLVPTS